ncbi:MAG TPA: protein translocase subunit SecF [Candidatus Babeliales bacterium]|nr:protein translocase subunit SecF [Candidatus Babeliales bacterium]
MIDFLKYRYFTALVSAAIIISFIGMAIYKVQNYGYAFTYSIDFTGGTQALLRFSKPVSSEELKNVLEQNGWHGATLRELSSADNKPEIIVRVKEFVNDAKGLAERIRHAVAAAFPGTEVTVLQSEGVGPGVGAELRWKAMMAVLIALLAIAIYIALTFWSFAFAMGAIVSLAHDAIVMLALFLFFDKDISINVIGAVLAVLGYSINDTIVIFSSIRHNIKKMPGTGIAEIVNISINQTLRRTLLTTFATLLTVTAMLVLGGESLYDFSLTLFVGILFGIYSTIYIASPVMMLLYKEKPRS